MVANEEVGGGGIFVDDQGGRTDFEGLLDVGRHGGAAGCVLGGEG